MSTLDVPQRLTDPVAAMRPAVVQRDEVIARSTQEAMRPAVVQRDHQLTADSEIGDLYVPQ